jgi:uncharacterized membrane protein YuzA (DUF378 family)
MADTEIPDLNVQNATKAVGLLGGLNWGIMETADTNLVTELLGTGNASMAYLVIGAAAAVTISEWIGITDLFEE